MIYGDLYPVHPASQNTPTPGSRHSLKSRLVTASSCAGSQFQSRRLYGPVQKTQSSNDVRFSCGNVGGSGITSALSTASFPSAYTERRVKLRSRAPPSALPREEHAGDSRHRKSQTASRRGQTCVFVEVLLPAEQVTRQLCAAARLGISPLSTAKSGNLVRVMYRMPHGLSLSSARRSQGMPRLATDTSLE